jgi:hypothetical protein
MGEGNEDEGCVISQVDGDANGEIFFPGDVGTVDPMNSMERLRSFPAYIIQATRVRCLPNSARSLDRHRMYLA